MIRMIVTLLAVYCLTGCMNVHPLEIDEETPSDSSSNSPDTETSDDPDTDTGTPVRAVQLESNVYSTCVRLENNALRCWGNELNQGYGESPTLGDDERVDDPSRHPGDLDMGELVWDVGVGLDSTCAVLESGSVRCFGNNSSGCLGLGEAAIIGLTPETLPTSKEPLVFGEKVVQIAAGDAHYCVLLEDGSVRCWGHDRKGALGDGNDTDEIIGDDELVGLETAPVPLGGAAQSVAAGVAHTCAIMSSGTVRCWGWGASGQLGYGDTDDIGDDEHLENSDIAVDLNDIDAVQIAAGKQHTCAILATGDLVCWGNNASGQLGYGHTDNIGDDETPGSQGPLNIGASVLKVAGGGGHTCAVLEGGSVKCWGANTFGQLGLPEYSTGGVNETLLELPNVELGEKAVDIAIGDSHTCAILESGKVRCWGVYLFGQLGVGTAESIGDDEEPTVEDPLNFLIYPG